MIQHLTQWGRLTHICISKIAIIGSDNGLSPGQQQAIIKTNAWLLSIIASGTNFSEILIKIRTFSFKKMHLKMLSAKIAAILSRGDELTLYQLEVCYKLEISIGATDGLVPKNQQYWLNTYYTLKETHHNKDIIMRCWQKLMAFNGSTLETQISIWRKII